MQCGSNMLREQAYSEAGRIQEACRLEKNGPPKAFFFAGPICVLLFSGLHSTPPAEERNGPKVQGEEEEQKELGVEANTGCSCR
jgi:hypothetical protein